MVATLVSEIVLCVKEVNIKTRAAAYALLVGLAHAMHAADPPPDPALPRADASGDVAMGDRPAHLKGYSPKGSSHGQALLLAGLCGFHTRWACVPPYIVFCPQPVPDCRDFRPSNRRLS